VGQEEGLPGGHKQGREKLTAQESLLGGATPSMDGAIAEQVRHGGFPSFPRLLGYKFFNSLSTRKRDPKSGDSGNKPRAEKETKGLCSARF